jgi:pimeloyl-ACP methyl ester carboxylesterase
LHGYLADKNSFAYQIPFFEREFDVYAIDFKGFGENKGMEYPYSLDDYVKQLLMFMHDNNIVHPHVIAHSFGARVALKATYLHNDLFDKLVLTGAAGLKPKKTFKKIVKKQAFNFLKHFVSRDKLKNFYSSDYLKLDSIMKESFIKIVGEHLDYVLPKVKNKTLIIFGENDKETPLYMAQKLNEGIANSKLIVLKDAGHFAFIDKSIKFNVETREFLLSKE